MHSTDDSMAKWLIDFLLESGFLDPAGLVDSAVEVADMSSRVPSFTVRSASMGNGLFVKVAVDEEQMLSLAHEAASYRLIRDHGPHFLKQRVPLVLLFDADRRVLITEYADNAGPLHQHVTHSSGESVEIGSALGEALASLHTMPLRTPVGTPDTRCGAPWIFTVTEPSVETYWEMSLATRELITRLQREPLFMHELRRLNTGWRARALTHGDLKSENVLICRSDPERRVTIVDWELLGIGDPLWDVGSVLHDGLRAWVASVPFAEGTGTALMRLAEYPIERSFPLVRSFWEKYAELLCWDETTSARALITAVEYAAVRLIQSAYESMQVESELTIHGVAQLQLSFNMLQRPRIACSHLLGLN